MNKTLSIILIAALAASAAIPAVGRIQLPGDPPETREAKYAPPTAPEAIPAPGSAETPEEPPQAAPEPTTGPVTNINNPPPEPEPGSSSGALTLDGQTLKPPPVPAGTPSFSFRVDKTTDELVIKGVIARYEDSFRERGYKDWGWAWIAFGVSPYSGEATEDNAYYGGLWRNVRRDGLNWVGEGRVDCHQFHGKHLEWRASDPEHRTWGKTIDCGDGFVPNNLIPNPLLPSQGIVRPDPLPREKKAETDIRPIGGGWMSIKITITPREAVYWATPGLYRLDPSWFYQPSYTLTPDLTDSVERTSFVRHPSGWEARFQCDSRLETATIKMAYMEDRPHGAQGTKASEDSIIPIPPCDLG